MSSLAIATGADAFQLGAASPATPFVVGPGADELVAVRFMPVADGLASGALAIGSDDPSSPTVEVTLSGEGLSVLDQAQQIPDILDEGLAQGLLVGVGRGSSATRRVAAFQEMLARATAAIEVGDVAEACDQLYAALLHTDGAAPPGDFITGAERASLAAEIAELRLHLGCEIP